MIPDYCFTPTALRWQRPTPEQIGEYLQQHGLTAYRVSKMIAVSTTTVDRWLSGEIQIKFAHWSALIRAVDSQ